MTAHGHATAKINAEDVMELIQGSPIEEAQAKLVESLPLSRPPQITVTPSWFPYLPFVDVNTQVEIIPGRMTP